MTTDRFRETAIKHARIIEEQKRVRDQVADLVLECFDLPSQQNTSPATPVAADAKVFKKALSLFQTSDFDELVSERNIDDRCGYTLCPNPNIKVKGGGNKVWNRKGGKNFKLLDRAEAERWCSKECGTRGEFVRAQLSNEPAWVRDETETKVTLLDDLQQSNDLAAAIKELSIQDFAKEDLEAKLNELSLERGNGRSRETGIIDIVEKDVEDGESQPPDPSASHSIEGHEPRKVRFDEEL